MPKTAKSSWLYRNVQMRFRRKSVRKRALRSGLVISNLIILVIILFFVVQTPKATTTLKPATVSSAAGTSQVINPVDQLSSANIALTVARLNSLPETTAISNQAQSQAADLAIISNGNNVLSKPQVVATALKSKADIQSYTTKANDTLSTLATQFGVTSDSIRWSNNISGNTVNAGTKLVIPPVNGLVYTVKSGDTIDSLATKYKASKDQIVAYNDAEINGIVVGEQIIIPNGSVAPPAPTAASIFASWGGPTYSGNGYDYGYCTWWVAQRRIQVGMQLPSNLGNASSWPYLGRLDGLAEGHTPAKYAATVTSLRGEGHVVFVEAVNADGSIEISEMNHLGWGVKDTQTISADVAGNYTYIY